MNQYLVEKEYTFSVIGKTFATYEPGIVMQLDDRWAAMVNDEQPGTLSIYEAKPCPISTPPLTK